MSGCKLKGFTELRANITPCPVTGDRPVLHDVVFRVVSVSLIDFKRTSVTGTSYGTLRSEVVIPTLTVSVHIPTNIKIQYIQEPSTWDFSLIGQNGESYSHKEATGQGAAITDGVGETLDLTLFIEDGTTFTHLLPESSGQTTPI